MNRLAWHRAEALVHATTRVERSIEGSWRHRGTAFFITEDVLLTCAHLVSGNIPTRVVVHGSHGSMPMAVSVVKPIPNKVYADGHYPLPDVALLRLVAEADRFKRSLPKLQNSLPGDDLLAFGYTDEYRAGQVLGHSCRFQLAGMEQADPADPVKIWRMRGDRIRPGMSGAPVLDLLTGMVIGIVKRTQDPLQDLGGFFVPVSLILEAIPEISVTVRSDDQEKLADQLWGNLFHTAAAILEDSPGARSWLANKLDVQDLSEDDKRQASQIAAELFRLDLKYLAEIAQGLVPILGRSAAAELFDAVSTCTDFGGDQWIAADIAAELAAQVEQASATQLERGRILDLQCGLEALRWPYRRRGNHDNSWKSPIECGPFSHEIDPVTRLPADLEQDLRAAIVKRFPKLSPIRSFAEPELTDQSRQEWENEWRPSLVESLRQDGVLVMLPPRTALDDLLVDALADEYSLVFLAISDGNCSPSLRAKDEYQSMQPQVDRRTAIKAFISYDSTRNELSEDAARRGA